ncbi:MAG: class I SAM-dependent methyltransferase [Synergistaceae bacterium]|jgi:SAM-dependent methyltransferase|nr:class I SAM-dependent methyltransferase [Synergistaceae bacterium]
MGKKNTSERIEREKDLYDRGIDRQKYTLAFGHAQSGYAQDRSKKKTRSLMEICKGKDVLEIGSQTWSGWIDLEHFAPKRLICINISDEELNKGIALSEKMSSTKNIAEHKFCLMDAHNLDFPEGTFDFVFGGGIIHHLEVESAIKEIHRVLKEDGQMLFAEPLGRNPVGKLVRKFTPNARTPDEKPLDKEEFRILKKYFDLNISYYQLFYVPAGFLSKYFFKSPYNWLMRCADSVDCLIEKVFKNTSLPLYFRAALIHGSKR